VDHSIEPQSDHCLQQGIAVQHIRADGVGAQRLDQPRAALRSHDSGHPATRGLQCPHDGHADRAGGSREQYLPDVYFVADNS